MGPYKEIPGFTRLVQTKSWKKAYDAYFGLADQDLFWALFPLKNAERETFWAADKTATQPWRLDPKYAAKLERWEYAYEVVHYYTIPLLAPDGGPDMPKYAKEYLEWRTQTGRTRTSLEQNLGYSMQTVNYVLTHLDIEGANWDKYRNPATSWEHWADKIRYAKELLEYPAELKQYNLEHKAKQLTPAQLRQKIQKYEKYAQKYKNSLDAKLYEHLRLEVKAESQAKHLAILDYYRLNANLAKSDKVGNCDENSMVSFMFLYDMKVAPIENFYSMSDHCFVIIGRNNVDPMDFANWGDTCVMCDPWAQGFRYGDIASGTYGGNGQKFKDNLAELLGGESELVVRLRVDQYFEPLAPKPAASKSWRRR